jgi:hypothetical protein
MRTRLFPWYLASICDCAMMIIRRLVGIFSIVETTPDARTVRFWNRIVRHGNTVKALIVDIP